MLRFFKSHVGRQERFLALLVSLLLFIGLAPFLKNLVRLRLLLDILFFVVFLTAIYTVSQNRRQAILVSLLALPVFIATWLSYGKASQGLLVTSHIFSIIFLAVAIVLILQFVIRAQSVTPNIIYAAIVVYLLIGITWSVMYSFLEFIVPGSFNNISATLSDGIYDFTYYSFVTLTTLGYGDIYPLNDQARALVILEAIIGQFYIAVLIARLVGTYISYRNPD
jgi:voltage-gated potassium channel